MYPGPVSLVFAEQSLKPAIVYYCLKLQSVSFASLSPSLCENLELQFCAELPSVRGAVSRHGSSADESNVLRWMCGFQSPQWCGCLLYCAITDSNLRLGIYDPKNNFTFIRRFYLKRLTVYSGYTFFFQYVCSLGIEPTTFCAANTMLYHWATGTTSVFSPYIAIWTSK